MKDNATRTKSSATTAALRRAAKAVEAADARLTLTKQQARDAKQKLKAAKQAFKQAKKAAKQAHKRLQSLRTQRPKPAATKRPARKATLA